MTQLFNNEYFGIGLIVTIAFLTVLFIIVLVMALKDAKKRSGEIPEEKTDKIPSESFAFKEEEPKEELQVPEVEEEKVEIVPTIEENKEFGVKEEVVPPEIKEEVVEEKEESKEEADEFKTADFSFEDLKGTDSEEKEPTINIDFEALAESLKNELDAETKAAEEPKEEVGKEVKPEDLFDNNTSEIPSINLEELKKFANELQREEEKPLLQNEEDTIKIVDSANSSVNVYLNNKEEQKIVKEEKVYGPPVKMKVPTMEMPKFASVPSDSVKVNKIEPVGNKQEEVVAPSFENIENETFSLK